MNIKQALGQLKRMLAMAKIFDSVINSSIVFLLFAVTFILTKIGLRYAFIPAGIYFLFHFIKNVKGVKYKEVEAKIPELEWQIRTAADNIDKDNEIVRRLHQTVLEEVQHIRTTSFFNNKQTMSKVLAITILSIAVVLTSMFHISILDLKETNPTGFFARLDDATQKIFEDEEFDGVFEQESDRNIYGEESIYELGNKDIDITLQRKDNQFDPDNINDADQRDFRGSTSTNDIGATSDSSYEENIKSKDKEIVKNYFNQITEGK